MADTDFPARRTQGIRPAEPLTRERIVEIATRLVDGGGASALTMRGLAAELGVSKTAVIWHIGDRSALLALIGATWLRRVVPPPSDGDAVSGLADLAHAYRAAAHRHPHLARLTISGLAATTTTGDIAVPEAVISGLTAAGIPDRVLVHAYNSIVAATIGFVALELASGVDADVPADLSQLDAERSPAICAHVEQLTDCCFGLAPTANRFDDSFGYLVDAVVAGLRRQAR